MKELWWKTKADELQSAADCHDMEAFYSRLKSVYGPRYIGTTPVEDVNGELITDRALILNRWVEHCQSVLNQQSQFDD
jgi:hypothetical protein